MKFWMMAAVMFAGLSASAQNKVGYVDVQKFIETTAAGKKAKTILDEEYNKRRKELDKKRTDLENMAKDLDKKRSVLSEEVFSKKQMELQEEGMKFQKNLADQNTEMQKKQKDLLDPIIDKMRTVLEKVAKEKGFSLVIEKTSQSFLYASADSDLTSDVVQAFDKEK